MVHGNGSDYGGRGAGLGGFQFTPSVEDWVLIDGKRVFVRGERVVMDPATGRPMRVRVSGNVLFDDFGAPFLACDFLGRSWSGLIVTVHTLQWCYSPFDFHPPRKCRWLGDGGFTEPDERAVTGGNYFLCDECLEHNEKLRNRRFWFGWLGYLPDIY